MPKRQRQRPGSLKERRLKRVGTSPDDSFGNDASLAETLDRVLTRGVVVSGEVVLSVAEIPLIYVGVQALVSSVETAADLAYQQQAA